MMDRLEIENFRGFDRLALSGLRRVNVLVGENNVGKTSVLEAIYLLQEALVSAAVERLLRRRGYVSPMGMESAGLFARMGATSQTLLSGGAGSDTWSVVLDEGEQGLRFTVRSTTAGSNLVGKVGYTLATMGEAARLARQPAYFFDMATVSDADVSDRIGSLLVARRRGELVRWLQSVDSRVVSVEQYKVKGASVVEAWVDLGLPQLVRLTQAGHGLRYATALFTELDGVKDAVVLIDEVESGLHHKAMQAIWQTIDAISMRNNLQIFVTTHSYECLKTADTATVDHPDDLAVFRIERMNDNKLAVFRLGKSERDASFFYGSEVR
jgi:hypothetical protein